MRLSGFLVFGLVEKEFFIQREVESFLFEDLEDFVSEIEVVNHAVVVWAEAN